MQVLNLLKLKILTPNGIFFDGDVEILSLKTTEGALGILHGHIPLVASIVISELHINDITSPNYQKCAISGGLLCVEQDGVVIISDAIEYDKEIDLSRAERAQRMAEKALLQKNLNQPAEFIARYSLLKAINRIKLKTQKQ